MAKVIRAHKRSYFVIAMLVLPFLLATIYGGCGSGTNNTNTNTCYLPDSSTPCFDPNIDGSTSGVIAQTVEEVIADQENMEGFQMSLAVDNIVNMRVRAPICPYEQSEFVIKTRADWNRFRNSCIYSVLDLPDVDFENSMVIVSNIAVGEFGTTIEAALEFDNRLVVVIEDSISFLPVPGIAFPISIVSVPRADLPVDFIRVNKDITSTIFFPCLDASGDSNILEDSIECPTDALVQMCHTFQCNNLDLFFLPRACSASSCFDFSCFISEFDNTFVGLGTGDFNIENVTGNQITGIVTIDFSSGGMEDVVYECSPFIN